MRNQTRVEFDKFIANIARLNNVTATYNTFSVSPSVQQTLEKRIQESSDFLKRINLTPVTELTGEALRLGITSTVAGRTKATKQNPRVPRNIAGMDSNTYKCEKTNFDTAVSYAQLDMWAKFPAFQTLLRDMIIRQQALDRIMIGFNGTSVAENTDRNTNPLLQDVNIGWLQKYRMHAPENVMTGEGTVTGKVTVGTKQRYDNLDALVFDAVNTLIDAQYQENPDLVVICGRDLLADKYFPLINKDQVPTEKLATDLIVSQKRMGGLQVVRAPFFPAGKMLITPLTNLSIYWQESGRRRHIREEPDCDQIANYESSNDAYVVELYEAGCLVENIEMVEETKPVTLATANNGAG
ncbi:phage major capsid protein, P2 family [Chitinimonas sp. PSY-7]|uniref:phage major capsid protein, P2 family n=1 Tax=Chitinimonas sp. PSY-7 TaxID=3459088 RepID=UPI00403FD8D3